MGFKSYYIQVLIRLGLLIAMLFLFVNLFYSDSFTFTKLLVGGIVAYQVWNIFRYLDKSNREVIGFLKSIQYDDFSHTYPDHRLSGSMDELYAEFNEVIRKFREIRAEKEAQHQYLKTIVQHVGIGIITFDKKGEIQIMNAAARRLLGVDQIKNLNQLNEDHPEFITSINELRTGGRDLIKISKNGNDVQLSIYAIELSLRQKEFKLISLQNIQSELEEKEMEAWQNLIRVLTHEIMNSVTPISSLAATVEGELDDLLKSGDEVNEINLDTIEDFHLALHTIHTRSESLIKFVSDFRNMTKVKHPELEEQAVEKLLKHVISLHRNSMEEQEIDLQFEVTPKDLKITIDKEQIEQVLINLVKNAIEALGENDEDEKDSKTLKIKAWSGDNGYAYVAIGDNGPGIDEEAQKKIFIPFFTTKKHGSGIGLSLSKQIMRNHQGTISVKSALNVGTEFLLTFQK